MTHWDIISWISIAVLILGSIAIFVWFLFDAVKLVRALGRAAGSERRGGKESRRDGGD
ncbi:MAG TPA: hypothetical protein VKZ58_01660 [Longimicrobiales bacterium]|nr:hypothetical protein [Longimicrobiales bacterium]